jgi:enoyl-CoA hydratase/carnithine racemase
MSLVRGFAVAAGFAFCLFSDFRVVEDTPEIYFALPEIGIGVFPYSVIALTYYYLPPSIATGIIFGGDKLSLERADELGLIHHKFKAEEFEKSAKRYIRSITSQNLKVQRMSKICYNYERNRILKYMQAEADFTQACLEPEKLTLDKIKELKQKWSEINE